jgi:spore coat protein A
MSKPSGTVRTHHWGEAEGVGMRAGISRRAVLASLGLTASGLGLSRSAGIPSPLLFHSPTLTPFVDDLPRLPSVPAAGVTLDVRTTLHRFHRDLPPSPAFAYGDATYLGPVLEAHENDTATVRVRNRLGHHPFAADIDTTVHGALTTDRDRPRTVLHLHGGVTQPEFDGHPMATIDPGQDTIHRFGNGQQATMLWYHDHSMGITRLNVYAGLASAYLLRDRWDTGQPDNPLGLPAGQYEMPLVMQEKIFNDDGSQSIRSTPVVPQGAWEGGAIGDVGLVNGVIWPQLDVARGLYRFRVLNAGSYSVWRLFFSNRMPFWVIGTDGGLLDAPVRTTSLRLSPAERVDLLVDFSGLATGDTVELRNDDPAPGQAAILGEVPMPLFCRFRAGREPGFRGPVPTRLRGGSGQPPVLPAKPRPDRIRDLSVNQLIELRLPPALMNLNNLDFDDPDIEMPEQGAVEQWNIVNTTPDPHPIHIHLVTFRILGRQPIDTNLLQLANPRGSLGRRWAPSADGFTSGPLQPPAAWEDGWKDTVRCDGNTVTRILIRFPTAEELGFDPDAVFTTPHDMAGMAEMPGMAAMPVLRGYVWHCHILDHEDHEMMLRYRLVPKG